MTVRELIKHLETLPQDFEVAYQCCSDVSAMEAIDITVHFAEEKRIIRHHNMSEGFRYYRDYEYRKVTMIPEFANIVMFPGN